ncbi:SDR family oxidoreductase [bacterium]|nr:SDR family oxidoreductase [bacterium]
MKNPNLDDIHHLKDKVVVITGSCGQLGLSMCNLFSKIGCQVIGIDYAIEGNRINNEDYYQLDIRKSKDVSTVMNSIFNKFKTVDVLINNAGVSVFEPFEDRSEENFEWVMNVNLKGTFNCIQKYVDNYDSNSQKQGCIINIASMYGVISPDFRIYSGNDRKNSEVYGATKAGVIQMSKYFAVHLAERNIRTNSISPGGIYNPENPQSTTFIKNYEYRCPMKRMANSDEISQVALFLASQLSSYVNGENISVDGGMSAW